MKIAPGTEIAPGRRSTATSAKPGASFTEMLAGRDAGAKVLDHRAMSFLERGVFGPSDASEAAAPPDRSTPTVAPAREEAPPADQAARLAPPDDAVKPGQTRGVTPVSRQSGPSLPMVGRAFRQDGSLQSAAPMPLRQAPLSEPAVAAGGAAAGLGESLRQRLAHRGPLSIRLQADPDGVVAIVVAAEPPSDLDQVADETFRFADERGLRLAGLVFNGVRITRPQLR